MQTTFKNFSILMIFNRVDYEKKNNSLVLPDVANTEIIRSAVFGSHQCCPLQVSYSAPQGLEIRNYYTCGRSDCTCLAYKTILKLADLHRCWTNILLGKPTNARSLLQARLSASTQIIASTLRLRMHHRCKRSGRRTALLEIGG